VNSKDYYNKSKKDASYRTLIGKVQEVDPDITRDTFVTKKNNNKNLEQRVYKGTKLVTKPQVSGAGAEELYAPGL